jgi:hypothetical protein
MTQEMKVILVVVLIIGVAFLAFKFSDAYKNLLSYLLLGAVWVIFIIALVWTAGVVRAYFALSPYVDPAQAQPALAAVEAHKIAYRHLYIIFVASNLYLWFLRYVYDLLEYLHKRRDAKIIREHGY